MTSHFQQSENSVARVSPIPILIIDLLIGSFTTVCGIIEFLELALDQYRVVQVEFFSKNLILHFTLVGHLI